MNIEKLFTLSQFVQLIESQIDNGKNNSENYSCAWAVDRICYYNKFLMQPLKKGMFVNEVECPDTSLYGSFATPEEEQHFEDGLYLWNEADEKVIFKLKERRIDTAWREYLIPKGADCFIEYCKFKHEVPVADKIRFRIRDVEINNIHDLAEATNGQLELQNVEL